MKWIGQHIWDYISRFRNDVYLEDISTGTIASGGNLGLDSNNKIVKADTEAGELTIANATDNRVVTSLGGTDLNAEANMTYTDGAGVSVLSSTNNFPKITLSNSSTGVTGPGITFQRTEVGADDDEIGTFDFWGEDEAGNLQNYGEIACYVADGTPGEEAGRLEFKVTEFDGGGGTPTTGLKIDGDTNENGEVDVTIGAGATSTTTIAGDLDIDGDALTAAGDLTINPSSDLKLRPNTGDTLLISSTSAKPSLQLQNTNTDAVAPEIVFQKTANGADGDDLGSIIFKGDDIAGNVETFAQILGEIQESADTDEEGKLTLLVASHDAELQPGLIIASGNAEDEVDVTIGNGATSLTTKAGTLTMGSTAIVNNSGVVQVATQGTIDHDSLANFVANEHIDWTGDVSASSVIHTNNITDLHGAGVDGSANQLLTDDGDGTVTSESQATCNDGVLALTSATTGYAAIMLTTTADGNKPTNFSFIKNRGSTTAADGDLIGFTSWISDNASGVAKYYAEHYVQATGVTSSDEHATHILTCATSTGTVSSRQNMITGLGSASDNTVNTTLGYGTASMCTIAGDLTLEGDQIRISGSSTQSARIALSEDTDNGTDLVTLAAPAATSGQTITLPDATGTVALNNKSYSFITCSFYDSLGSTLHYLPLSDTIGEQTSEGNTYTDWIAPCATTVKHVIIRFSNIVASKDVTLTVWKDPIGSGTKSSVEAETLQVGASNENDVHMWTFDSAAIAKGEVLKISIQSDGTSISSSNCHAKVVLELDWDDMYSGSSQIFTS